MLGVIKPVWIGKVGIFTAKLGGFCVHLFHKARNTVAHIIGKHKRGVVSGGEHQAV